VDPIWIEDAKDEFNVSRSTLQRWIRSGQLSRILSKNRLRDRKVYVDRDELTKLLKESEGWVVEKRTPTDAPPRHPGGRPLGTGKRPRKR
jgi:predicted site-specific integrase-resolvase